MADSPYRGCNRTVNCGLRIADCGLILDFGLRIRITNPQSNPHSAIRSPQSNPQSAIRNPQLHVTERDSFPQRHDWVARRHELVRDVALEAGVDDRAADG